MARTVRPGNSAAANGIQAAASGSNVYLNVRRLRGYHTEAMPHFARQLVNSLRSAALVAAALLLSTSAISSARIQGSRPEWSDTPAVQALPVVQSSALRHGEAEARQSRRGSPHLHASLAAHAGQWTAFAFASITPAITDRRPLADIVARGYDATAPPVS
jgi:hypothetical protein